MATSGVKIAINPNPDGVFPPRRRWNSSSMIRIPTLSNRSRSIRPFSCPAPAHYERTYVRRSKPVQISGSNMGSGSEAGSFDVVIVGAGIIGLTIARQFLLGSNLSVAVIDAAVPCAGATGAGQGYIWKVHKAPGSEKWELAMRSHKLWEELAQSIHNQGMDPFMAIGWKKTGSLLVGRTAEDCSVLKKKVEQLVDAGLHAEFLSSDGLSAEEPALTLGEESGAAFMPDDCQLDARCAVAYIEKANRDLAAEGRYAEFYYEPVTGLLRSESNGEVEAVQTSKSTLRCRKAVIIAAGCWSGSLMHNLLRNSEIELDLPVKPRKGHLLILENFKPFDLNHGLMEVGYVNHESAIPSTATDLEKGENGSTASISMTATKDMSGRLVLGSSRQFVGFDTKVDESILHRIWQRASEFFPVLKEVLLNDLIKSREVRVGLRPYMHGGKPMIGSVLGLSKTFVAAGHEGEGLSLALGTAEMVFNMVLENPQNVDPTPFSL